ncbi:hypothetical protein ACYJGC_005134 [Klebsiella pneumoniae]|uniref:hypothetical protein n=1 Tax=Klebsiella pneumoniae TaxID=573 RepID=UPI001CBC2B0B|nr:hypothetical protein [Klebsiella pneumoniae]EKX7637453.1 hypothetical protein [Klebsiella pneumoniae]ELA1308048.1 hypothetical protein [Klebsiella pneumoniae]MBZ1696849.1 hypothetical protein [Klebsiella pneumoniae]HDZ2531267.1 hypothetical protein [Klebsiella pneumoniae]HDZ2539739.1 hypothetical protein [Klebsiella pneumoniae]
MTGQKRKNPCISARVLKEARAADGCSFSAKPKDFSVSVNLAYAYEHFRFS